VQKHPHLSPVHPPSRRIFGRSKSTIDASGREATDTAKSRPLGSATPSLRCTTGYASGCRADGSKDARFFRGRFLPLDVVGGFDNLSLENLVEMLSLHVRHLVREHVCELRLVVKHR